MVGAERPEKHARIKVREKRCEGKSKFCFYKYTFLSLA
jgi:hypothetical protein